MDATKFLKDQARMCRSHENCSTCPLRQQNLGTMCTNISDDDIINRKIAIVEEWVKEHPAKTRMSEFLKQFPNASTHDGLPVICPRKLEPEYYEKQCGKELCSECQRKYWLEEVE